MKSSRKGVYNIYRAHKVPHKSKMGSYRAWVEARTALYKAVEISSRHVPNRLKIPPVGSWLYEDHHKGMYGHDIWQLVSFKPSALTPMESMVERNEEGRGDDARRYMEWWAKGSEPPPIRVIQSEGGDLRITDGHRRYFAAKLLGKPIKAWVSWTIPSPRYELGQGDLSEVYNSAYPLIATGLTYEIAEARGWVARNGQANRQTPKAQRNAFSRSDKIRAKVYQALWRLTFAGSEFDVSDLKLATGLDSKVIQAALRPLKQAGLIELRPYKRTGYRITDETKLRKALQ